MPNLPAHIELAAMVAERLGPSALDGNLGYFLLGSTSPDIRAITKADRQDYHFAPLSFESVGAGVDGMLSAHPELRDAAGRDGPTGAFVAGYMTHLIYDETWIVEMFRPCFGNSGVFADEMEGKVLDRALQLDLDRQAQPRVAASLPAHRHARRGVSTYSSCRPRSLPSGATGWSNSLDAASRGTAWTSWPAGPREEATCITP